MSETNVSLLTCPLALSADAISAAARSSNATDGEELERRRDGREQIALITHC